MKKLSQIIAILFIMGYMASPIDIVPDIPIIGWSDDIGVTLIMLWASGVFDDDKPTYSVLDNPKRLPGE